MLAVNLLEANLHLEHKEDEVACRLLEQVYREYPKHPYVLKLLQQAYRHLGRWDSLLDLLPQLKKRDAMETTELLELESLVYENSFKSKIKEIDELKGIWRAMPKNLRSHSQVAEAYARRLIKADLKNEAEEIIADAIKKEYSVRLVKLYGQLDKAYSKKHLLKAEVWLQQYGESIELLTTLARVAMASEAYEQAKKYANRSLQLEETPETYALLAAIEERLGDHYASQQAIAKAVELVS